MRKIISLFVIGFALVACNSSAEQARPQKVTVTEVEVALHPGETARIRELVNRYADYYQVPRALVHKSIQRESQYRAGARNGPYFGLMQILPETARTMGFQGANSDLLDAETNLIYAVKYLRGAWLLSDGNMDRAILLYARGYYYEARNRCMLVVTGLRRSEVRKYCPNG